MESALAIEIETLLKATKEVAKEDQDWVDNLHDQIVSALLEFNGSFGMSALERKTGGMKIVGANPFFFIEVDKGEGSIVVRSRQGSKCFRPAIDSNDAVLAEIKALMLDIYLGRLIP